jgi:hypothetical protein
MKLLLTILHHFGIDDVEDDINITFLTFINVLVVMLTLTFLLGFSLLVYDLITNGVSDNVNFGILE